MGVAGINNNAWNILQEDVPGFSWHTRRLTGAGAILVALKKVQANSARSAFVEATIG